MAREHSHALERDGRTHAVMYHPAAALRSADIRSAVAADFQALQQLLIDTHLL